MAMENIERGNAECLRSLVAGCIIMVINFLAGRYREKIENFPCLVFGTFFVAYGIFL